MALKTQQIDRRKTAVNMPRSIYQNYNMAPRLSGKTSEFGVVFLAFKSLSEIERINIRIAILSGEEVVVSKRLHRGKKTGS